MSANLEHHSDTTPIILGAGGHALTVVDQLRFMGISVRAIVDPKPKKFLDMEHFGSLNLLPSEYLNHPFLVCIGDIATRKRVFEETLARIKNPYLFIAENSYVSKDSIIGNGSQILMASVIETKVKIGSNTIINVGASVHHESSIGSHSNISPGVRVLGGVQMGNEVLVGSNSVIFPGIRIGDNVEIGAGLVIRHDIDSNATMR
jgi:UDP-perosamine 4-acetyltransferase